MVVKDNMTTHKSSRYFRRQATICFAVAVAVFAVWLFMWLSNDEVTNRQVRLATASTPSDFVLPDRIDRLDELRIEVPPISFDTITRDLRSYPSEFKDRSYFEANKNKWTVQVMDVAEHKLIVDYLEGRDDRQNFAYFRYTDANQRLRYMLTYGIMSSFQEAMGTTKLIDFRLPNSARTLPEEMSRYLGMIDNYERPIGGEQKIEELAPATKVELKETTQVVDPEPALDEEVATDKPKEKSDNPKETAFEPATTELSVPPTVKINEPKPADTPTERETGKQKTQQKQEIPIYVPATFDNQ